MGGVCTILIFRLIISRIDRKMHLSIQKGYNVLQMPFAGFARRVESSEVPNWSEARTDRCYVIRVAVQFTGSGY